MRVFIPTLRAIKPTRRMGTRFLCWEGATAKAKADPYGMTNKKGKSNCKCNGKSKCNGKCNTGILRFAQDDDVKNE